MSIESRPVVTRPGRRRRLRRGEKGVTIAFVLMTLIPLIIVTATAVDLGSARSETVRLQHTADASALAAVPALPIVAGDEAGETVARNIALSYAQSNLDTGAFTATGCEAGETADAVCYASGKFYLAITTPYTTGGSAPDYQRIKVEICEDVDDMFAGAVGLTAARPCRSTIASGTNGGIGGLRPFGLCAEATQAIADLVNSSIIPSGPQTITYDKEQPDACNGDSPVPGNWGMIDFNGGANSNAETQEWVELGYYGLVESGTGGSTCETEPEACYDGDTGAFSNSLADELQTLVDSGVVFALPVFDLASGTGSNAQVHLVEFIAIRLIGFQTTGNQANRYLEFEVVAPGIIPGPTCCDQTPTIEG